MKCVERYIKNLINYGILLKIKESNAITLISIRYLKVAMLKKVIFYFLMHSKYILLKYI